MTDQIRTLQLLGGNIEQLQSQIVALATELSDRDTEPHVVGSLRDRMRSRLSRRGLRWVNLDVPVSTDAGEHRAVSKQLVRLIDDLRPSLIHAHGFEAGYTACMAIEACQFSPPVICSPHGILTPFSGGILERFHRGRVRKYVLRRATVVTARSSSEKKALAELDSRRRQKLLKKIRLIPAGVEPRGGRMFDAGEKRNAVGLRRDASIVVATGPLEDYVPFEDFLRAAAIIGDEMPSLDVGIIGEGPQKEHLQQLAHGLRIYGNTVFLPNRHDVLEVIGSCNVLVALTDDAIGINRALSALDRNVSVVATDQAGLREIFDDVDAVPIVADTDNEQLAEAIQSKLGTLSEDDEPEVTSASVASANEQEMLVSEAHYDLDTAGLEQSNGEETASRDADVENLLQRHSLANTLKHILDLYNDVL